MKPKLEVRIFDYTLVFLIEKTKKQKDGIFLIFFCQKVVICVFLG
jgi:hypothetical protein